jgi:hypothetical protein
VALPKRCIFSSSALADVEIVASAGEAVEREIDVYNTKPL